MMSFLLTARTVLLHTLLVVLGAGSVAGGLLLVQQVLTAKAPASAKEAKAPAREEPRRTDENTIVLPPDSVAALGLKTAEARVATGTRSLPALAGCLALDSNRLVRIHPRFAGEVVALGTLHGSESQTSAEVDSTDRPLRYGDPVVQGQLLAVIWSKDLGEKKSELVEAQSRLEADRVILNQVTEAQKSGSLPERSVRDARRTVDSDLIALARTERTLRSWRLDEEEINAIRKEAAQPDKGSYERWARVEVRSPRDGVLVEKNVTLGDMVDTGSEMFKVADLRRLAVWVHAYEEDLPALQKLPLPTSWTVHLPSRPDVSFPGALEQIGEVIDPTQHTALLAGHVNNPHGELKVGQYVTATIELLPPVDEVEVPTSGLVEDGRESVFFVQPDPDRPSFERRRVTVLRRTRDTVFLRSPSGNESGVRPGDRVVTGGAVLLNEALQGLAYSP